MPKYDYIIMNIAICGKMCAGKTTLSNYMCQNHGFTRISLADPVREFAKLITNSTKKDSNLLQRIGQGGRDILYQDVWVEVLKRRAKNINGLKVIDDVRYLSEVESLRSDGWIIVKIEISPEVQRKRIVELYKEDCLEHLDRREHISETEMDTIPVDKFDIIVDGTIPIPEIYYKCIK